MKKILFPLTLLFSITAMAQITQGDVKVDRAEDIQQGKVTVNRKYEPNVEAAEKIKQTPVEEKTAVVKKYQPTYQPQDIEAASDFETSTIGADELPVKSGENYSNYIEVGYGNNANLLLNGFVGYNVDENSSFGFNAGYRAAKANLDQSLVDDGYTNLNIDGFYRYNLDNAMAKIGLGTQVNTYDLYGYRPSVQETDIGDIETITYTNINAYGIYDVFDSYWLDEVKAEYDFYVNNHKSNENNLRLNAIVGSKDLFDFSLLGSESFGLTAKANLEYQSTNFDSSFRGQEKDFSFFNTGISPQLIWLGDFIDIAAGANIQYLNDDGDNNNKLLIAPQAEITVKPIPELKFRGGVSGGVDLRTLKEMTAYNPYLFNHQQMKPSITKIDFYVGVSGDVNTDFKYAVTAGYQKLDNIIGYYKMPIALSENASYGKGNSFHSYFDDGSRSYLDAEFNYFGIESFDFSGKLSFQKFDIDNYSKLYEIPKVNANLGAAYKLLDQRLKLGADLIFTGARTGWETEDQISGEEIDLGSYVDLNLNARYRITNQFTVFVLGQNLINSQYKRFTDYRVQGLHVMGGIMFQF